MSDTRPDFLQLDAICALCHGRHTIHTEEVDYINTVFVSDALDRPMLMEYQIGTASLCITGVPAVTRGSSELGTLGQGGEWVRGMTSFLLLTTTSIYKRGAKQCE